MIMMEGVLCYSWKYTEVGNGSRSLKQVEVSLESRRCQTNHCLSKHDVTVPDSELLALETLAGVKDARPPIEVDPASPAPNGVKNGSVLSAYAELCKVGCALFDPT